MSELEKEILLLLQNTENEHLEFKKAETSFEFKELVKYCCALANENGGKMILGVTDKPPRKITGTAAFENPERTKIGLLERLHLRITIQEYSIEGKRVLIVDVPPRPIGMPVQYKGVYWMRAGESLVPMSPDQLKRIFDEAGPDISAEICNKANIDDLDSQAIENFRRLWQKKSGNRNLENLTPQQLLEDAELTIEGQISYAALILLGTPKALSKYLAQAEIIFEYRSSESSVQYQQRKEFRKGIFLCFDELWDTINLRNDIQHYQDGLFVWDIPTFNERIIREAVLNAISHRDYRLPGSVFIRQFPKKLEVVSPGGLPAGVTLENILNRQFPRNRRIAEVFSKCGLVERSGQGMNLIYESCIKESKSIPDFTGTDDYQVSLTLNGEVQDIRFLKFLEKIGQETLASFKVEDLILMDAIHRGQKFEDNLKGQLSPLIDK